MTLSSIFGFQGQRLTDWERDFFREVNPFGFIIFSRNIDTPEQLRRLTSELRNTVGRDAPILIDQEGGRVQRMREPHWLEWLAPLDQAVQASDVARSFYIRSRIIAEELRSVGIDVNCTPTCDIAGPQTHPFLRNRCLGTDPKTVLANARATADGLLDGGVLPVMKHLPGHGRGSVDSHLDLPVVNVSLDVVVDWDFAPFRSLNDLPMGMTAHIVYEACGSIPATLNPDIINIIRNDIGFNGLLMTDDISMEALLGTVAVRTAASIAAGCDVVLHCNGDKAEMQAVADAAGILTNAAAIRCDAAVAERKKPDEIDIVALCKELKALLK